MDNNNLIEDILNEGNKLDAKYKAEEDELKREEEEAKQYDADYLSSCFPTELQIIADFYSITKDYEKEYFCLSMLTALGLAIGNTHVLCLNNGYKSKCNVFAMIVGNAGVNKSEPLKDAFKPIQLYQDRLYDNYIQELEEYKKLDKESKEDVNAPQFCKPMTTDSTIEGVAVQLTKYKRGTVINADELASFVNSMIRYNSNSESYFLSYWNGSTTIIDRATKEGFNIKNPFLSIIGTIQPTVLDTMFKNKEDNGFYDRFLICYKPDAKIPIINDYTFDYSIESSYIDIFNKLLSFELHNDPYIVHYSPESWKRITNWDNEHNATRMLENDCTETERSIRAKMRIYLHRFALIIQLSNYACGETQETNFIELDAVEKAIKLTKYFTHQALLKRLTPTASLLKGKEKELYDALPDYEIEFDRLTYTKFAVDFIGMKEKQATHFLYRNIDQKGKRLFKSLSRGKYCKV